jgi:hypothetical protein
MPAHDWPLILRFLDRPPGTLLDVREDQAGIGLVRPPGLKAPGDGPCDQGTTGLKLGVPCFVDEDGALEIDPVILPAVLLFARVRVLRRN